MAAEDKTNITPDLLERWRSQCSVLQEKLREEPLSSHRWIWQLRLEIIAYLLKRHAPAAAGPIAQSRPITDAQRQQVAAETAAYDPPRLAGVPTVPPGTGRPPQARAQIQSRLHDLHDANCDRNAAIERERQQAVAEFAAAHDQIRATMRQRLFAELAQQQAAPPWRASQPPPPPPASSPLMRALAIPAMPVPELNPAEAVALLSLTDQQLRGIASEAMSEEDVLVLLRGQAKAGFGSCGFSAFGAK